MATANPPANRTDFKIAVLCALPLEAEAVLPLFEVVYSGDQYRNLTKASDDANAYTLGRIGEFNIILVHMPNAGKQAAASVAVHLKRSYPGIELSFLLGVCGGVPIAQDMDRPGARRDIFLGDVIVSHGVVQYDLGTRLPNGFVRKDTLTSNLGRPSQKIRSIIAMMEASHKLLMPELLFHLAKTQEAQEILYPGSQKDILFRSTYEHSPTNCQCFFDVSKIEDSVISRRRTPDVHTPCPNLHFGFVASGDMVIKSATYRDQVSEDEGVIGFEMELAGIWDSLPLADYADSHKNKEWQRFAAASSAACLRSLLDFTPIPLAPLESGPSRGSSPCSPREGSLKRPAEDAPNSSPIILQTTARIASRVFKKQQTLKSVLGGPSKQLKSPSKQFTGREDFIQQLRLFFSSTAVPRVHRRDFVLYGPGGFGKTQICLKFAEECADIFWKIFLVDASNTETLNSSFREIALDPDAKTNGVVYSADSIVQWLSSQRREWLLIFDNADEAPAAIEGFLVDSRYGNTLITTRNPNMRELADEDGFAQVGQMTENEAVLLLSRLSYNKKYTPETHERMKAIVHELGYVPLAIQHAASSISSGFCNFSDYLKIFRRHPFRLLADPAMRGASNYQNNLIAAWETSLSAIQNDNKQLEFADSTLGLMQVFSFFHPNDIMEDIFRRATRLSLAKPCGGNVEATAKGKSDLPTKILSVDKYGEWDPIAFRTAIQTLYRYSFIEIHHTASTYSLHPLVHYWIRHRMTKEQQAATFRTAIAILDAAIERQSETTDYSFYRHLLPHVHALQRFRVELDLPEEYFDDAYDSYWTVFEVNERWQEARDLGLQVMKKRRKFPHENDAQEIDVISRLSWAFRMLGTLDEAEELQKKALSYRRRVLGDEHKETLESMASLAWIYFDQARYKEAEDLQAYVYKTFQRLNCTKHSIFNSATALSATYCGQNKWEEAVELLELVIGNMKSELGVDNITTVDAMARLAAAYHAFYLLEAAEKMKLDVLRIRKKIQGDRHPATLTAAAELAATYVRQDRLDEALELMSNVIEAREEVLGKTHRDTLTSLLILTNIYIRKERWVEAEDVCKQVIAGRKSVLPVNHPHTLWAKAHLALIHHYQGLLDESAREWQDVIAAQQEVRGSEHMETLLSMHNLALVWKSQG
ncbi:hypothetical protein IFM47457_06586 [Aspergillus lentulus]|nr:hypothetical protein IFM47457_06586 [Aspergillus lentulus]